MRIFIVLGLVAAAVVFLAHTALASNTDTAPGWGFGDTNHVHTGPPGQSVHP